MAADEENTAGTAAGSIPTVQRHHKVRAAQLGVLAMVVGTIEFGPKLGYIDSTTLIPLSEMTDELLGLLASGALTPHIQQTFAAVFGAFLLAILTGLPAGVVLWRHQLLKRVLDPYLLIYYAVPFFAFYPLLITIFGLGIVPILLIAWGFSVAILVSNTASGLENIPDVYVKAGKDMNLTRRQLLVYVYFPAAVPYVFTGLKLGFIYALIGTVASEFILAESGLGWLISFSYNNFDVRGMFAAMLLIILLALVVNTALTHLERRLYRRVGA